MDCPSAMRENAECIFIQCRTVVLCITDLKAHVDYILFHGRCYFTFSFSGVAYHFEIAIIV